MSGVLLVWKYSIQNKMPPGADLPMFLADPKARADLNTDLEFMRNDLACRTVWGEPEVKMLSDYAQRESPSARQPVLGKTADYSADDLAQDYIAIQALLIIENRLFHGHKITEDAGPRCVKILLDQITSPVPSLRLSASQSLANSTSLVLVPQVRERLLTLRADPDPYVRANVDRQLAHFDKHVAAGLVKPLPEYLVRWTNEALKMK